MKPNPVELDNPEVSPSRAVPYSGDVIGNTAYSERFVLKILLKLANLETLKEALADKSFEDDLCILWDMTAEKDVVMYIKQHNVLKIINFVLPSIEDSRIIEILIGILGNMCVFDEVVEDVIKMDHFIHNMFFHIKFFDPRTLLQIQRLVSACIFRANNDMIATWMRIFKAVDYAKIGYFILKNSTYKDLLITALENLNTICAGCNQETTRTNFFLQFVIPEAIESIKTGFLEVVIKQNNLCDDEMLERLNLITLQIILSIIGFEKSHDIFKDNKEDVAMIISTVLRFYKDKISENTLSADLADIGEALTDIFKMLQMYTLAPDNISDIYEMWRVLYTKSVCSVDSKERCDFESTFEEDKEYAKMLNTHFGFLICYYLKNCSKNNFIKLLDIVNTDCDDIINSIGDDNFKCQLREKISDYRCKRCNDSG